MKVVVSTNARAELEEIRRWIAHDDPRRALTFVREVRTQIKGLASWSRRFPAVDPADETIRRLNHGSYRALYRVMPDYVVVLNIHHGRRSTPDDFS